MISKKIFDVPDRAIVEPKNFQLNCHECGNSFCPVDAFLMATSRISYYNNILCRLFYIQLNNPEQVCKCQQKKLSTSPYIWMYDRIDPMPGKILTKKDEE